MSDELKLLINDDGEAEVYDDTYDITIHCTSMEEKNKAIKLLNEREWTPCKMSLPEEDGEYIASFHAETGDFVDMCSFENGQWVAFLDGMSFPIRNVVAWMHIPDAYKEEHEDT